MIGSLPLNTPQSLPDPAVLARAAAKVKRHVLPLFVVMFIVNSEDRRDHPVDKGPDPYDNLDDPSNCTKAVTDCLS